MSDKKKSDHRKKKGEMPVNLLVAMILLFLLFLAATILYVTLSGKSEGLLEIMTKAVGWD